MFHGAYGGRTNQPITVELQADIAEGSSISVFDTLATLDAAPLPERGRDQTYGVEDVDRQRALRGVLFPRHVQCCDPCLINRIGLDCIDKGLAGIKLGGFDDVTRCVDAGHGRLQAARELGLPKVPAV